MSSSKVFIWLAAASGFTGAGMMLGYAVGNSTDNTPLWVGALLLLFGAVLLGMSISASDRGKKDTPAPNEEKKTPST